MYFDFTVYKDYGFWISDHEMQTWIPAQRLTGKTMGEAYGDDGKGRTGQVLV